jgi:hypothetical protein
VLESAREVGGDRRVRVGVTRRCVVDARPHDAYVRRCPCGGAPTTSCQRDEARYRSRHGPVPRSHACLPSLCIHERKRPNQAVIVTRWLGTRAGQYGRRAGSSHNTGLGQYGAAACERRSGA